MKTYLRRAASNSRLRSKQKEAKKRLLACFGKTRQGMFEKEKFVMPTFAPPPPNPSTMAAAAASSASTPIEVKYEDLPEERRK